MLTRNIRIEEIACIELDEGCLAGQSQRMATAIEAGLANRVCGIDEIIGLLATPEREPAA